MQEEIELYNKVLKEEEELVFAHISQDDLIRLGFMIHQANQGYPGPVAVLIRLNGKDVFSCYPEGTGAYHRMWLERKANTVHVREMSSLRAYLLLQQNNEDIEKDWMLPAQEYAAPYITRHQMLVRRQDTMDLPQRDQRGKHHHTHRSRAAEHQPLPIYKYI